MKMLIRALLVLLAGSTAAHATPKFEPVEIAPHVYSGGWEHFVGGGLAGFDCNGDNLPELFAAGGAAPAALFINTSQPGKALKFRADTPPELALTGVTGAYPIDFNNDGAVDLAVLRAGKNLLLQGSGDCRFERMADHPQFGDAWTTAFSATWEGSNALPTLAFGNYVDRENPKGPFETCDANTLYRPVGASWGPATKLQPGFCALSVLFSDWGRRGRADLRVSNDRHYYVKGGQEQMWAMETTPRLYGPEDGWVSYQLWGMGIASRDISGDGLPDVYLTSMGDQKLQTFDSTHGGPKFDDATYARGTTAHRPYTGGDGRPSTGWHVAFGDVQNDGLDDIFVAKGNVEQMPDAAMQDPNNLLVQLPDGRFEETGEQAGLADLARSRGAVLADLDLDGRLDIAVVNRRAPMMVYRNVTPEPGNWVSIDLRQPSANTFAIGAWLEVEAGGRVYTREVTIGGGHAGGVLLPQHFGIGTHEKLRARVAWPDGEVTDWQDLTANTAYLMTRIAGGVSLSSY